MTAPRTSDERFDAIEKRLEDIHDRLFVDNGRPSLQTRLDRIDRLTTILAWTLTALAGAGIATIVPPLIHRIAEVL